MPSLNWIGKDAVVNHHKEVPFHLLKCNEKLSVAPQTSEVLKTSEVSHASNLLVQGDNLLALKALLPHYAGQVKCIYIDPPYNTGKQKWVYNDAVNSLEIREWLGKVVGDDTEDLSRHDKWLCMMYPRLALLRELLSEGGVIFISLDDNEVHSLRFLMNEIFGAKNFVTQFIWNTEGHTDNQLQVKVNHEYITLYAKDINKMDLGYIVDPSTREESNLWKGYAENSITKNGAGNPPSEVELPVGFPCNAENLILEKSDVPNEFYTKVKGIGYITRQATKEYEISYPIRLDKMIVKNNKLTKVCRVFSGWANVNKLKKFIQNNCQPIQDDDGSKLLFYLSERGVIYYKRERENARNILSVVRNMGTTEQMRSELEKQGLVFQYPKPKELIKYIIRAGSKENDIILDSFAGSGTTGQAVLELNKEDENSNRNFILIEMDKEICTNITRKRLELYSKDSGFRFCELSSQLFSPEGHIQKEMTYEELARHIYFTETGTPFSDKFKKKFPLIGIHNEVAVYLLYNGVMKDKSRDGGNILTRALLATLPEHGGTKVIYGNGTLLSENTLRSLNITFKQVPYEIKVS